MNRPTTDALLAYIELRDQGLSHEAAVELADVVDWRTLIELEVAS